MNIYLQFISVHIKILKCIVNTYTPGSYCNVIPTLYLTINMIFDISKAGNKLTQIKSNIVIYGPFDTNLAMCENHKTYLMFKLKIKQIALYATKFFIKPPFQLHEW